MLDWRMQLHYVWCVVVTVDAMADYLGASNYQVHDACRTMHATCHITSHNEEPAIPHRRIF
jgi:hypothetical protein